MDIAQIDPNFSVPGKVTEKDVVFYHPLEAPFRLYGVFPPNETENRYHRLPQSFATQVNEGVASLCKNTSGGRFRFMTDSPYVAIYLEFPRRASCPNISPCGFLGLDLFADGFEEGERYMGTFVPPCDAETCFESRIKMPSYPHRGELRTVTVNLPLYNDVTSIRIGLSEGSALLPPKEYTYTAPVVYYGSSITQGGCASHPGNSYQAILSRWLDCDFLNFGFSGSAKGEPVMAQYLAGLNMSVFVLDYDHNAPTPEHLQKTHEPFFQVIRQAHPTLPILIMTRPKLHFNEDDAARFAVVKATYDRAVAAGDRNVYFLSGQEFFKDYAGECATVDNCHPNDLGFMAMARAMAPVLASCLKQTV